MNEDTYPLRAKIIDTFHGANGTIHGNGQHQVTRDDMYARLKERGFTIYTVRGFMPRTYEVGGTTDEVTANVAIKGNLEKQYFTVNEAREFQAFVASNYPPYVYFNDDGPWTKYPSSDTKGVNPWHKQYVPVTYMEEGVAGETGQK